MIDAYVLAELDKSEPLVADGGPPFTCVICGAKQPNDAWRVKLPRGRGKACTWCAGDAGWEIR